MGMSFFTGRGCTGIPIAIRCCRIMNTGIGFRFGFFFEIQLFRLNLKRGPVSLESSTIDLYFHSTTAGFVMSIFQRANL